LQEFPDEDDLRQLKEYQIKMITELTGLLTTSPNAFVWRQLAEIILCHLIIFNARRGSEAEHDVVQMRLEDLRPEYGDPELVVDETGNQTTVGNESQHHGNQPDVASVTELQSISHSASGDMVKRSDAADEQHGSVQLADKGTAKQRDVENHREEHDKVKCVDVQMSLDDVKLELRGNFLSKQSDLTHKHTNRRTSPRMRIVVSMVIAMSPEHADSQVVTDEIRNQTEVGSEGEQLANQIRFCVKHCQSYLANVILQKGNEVSAE
jgi:hypothetical protein